MLAGLALSAVLALDAAHSQTSSAKDAVSREVSVLTSAPVQRDTKDAIVLPAAQPNNFKTQTPQTVA